jgi:hypothetical protein
MNTPTPAPQVPPSEAPANDCYLPARRVWERYGVTSMSLHRWLNDERVAFPRPFYINRFRYWKLSDLLAWERDRARQNGRAS